MNLAEDIAEKGLNPSDLPLVTPMDDGNFLVLEGNRRIAALKLLTNPQLLSSVEMPPNTRKRLRSIVQSLGADLPSEIDCAVVAREDATHWINLKHTGENNGIGIVPWDGRARQRFRGSSPALQAIEMVENTNLLDKETKRKLAKIAITNVERILSTPEVRKALGVDVQDRNLFLLPPEPEALGRLAMVVADVANKKIKVTQIDTKAQRINYAQEVAARPLPVSEATDTAGDDLEEKEVGKVRKARTVKPDRKSLIPKSCKLTIHQTRINKIYHELQSLDVGTYTNSCSVMFRVFLELSLDHFARQKKIHPLVKPGKTPVKTFQDMSLRDKIEAVYKFMEANGIAERSQLRGIKALHSNKNHVLSIDSLHAYVHNLDYAPAPSDLKANWDSIQVFIEKLWEV